MELQAEDGSNKKRPPTGEDLSIEGSLEEASSKVTSFSLRPSLPFSLLPFGESSKSDLVAEAPTASASHILRTEELYHKILGPTRIRVKKNLRKIRLLSSTFRQADVLNSVLCHAPRFH